MTLSTMTNSIDTQHNDNQHIDNQHNYNQHNDKQNDGTQQSDSNYNNTQHKEIQQKISIKIDRFNATNKKEQFNKTLHPLHVASSWKSSKAIYRAFHRCGDWKWVC